MAGRNRKLIAISTRIIACTTILTVAGAGYYFMEKTRPLPEKKGEGHELRRVVVMPAHLVDVRREFDGFGTAEAMDSSDVPTRVTSIVVELPPEILPGNPVRKGQLLVRLDESDFVRWVEIASNSIVDLDGQLKRLSVEDESWGDRVKLAGEEVKLALDEFNRILEAFARDAARQREIDQARLVFIRAERVEVNAREEANKIPARRLSLQAQRMAQESTLKLAQENLRRCRIVSPLDGVLQFVDVEIGENVSAGQRVVRVVNHEKIEVLLRLPASSRPHLSIGDLVELESAGNTRQSWEAKVARIAPEDDTQTRTVGIYVEFKQDPNASDLLAPGKFVRGRVTTATALPRWVVPRRSLRADRITIVKDGRIVSLRVDVDFQVQHEYPELGLPDDLWLVLSTPLTPESLVVVVPSRSLSDGLEVDPVLYSGVTASGLSSSGVVK